MQSAGGERAEEGSFSRDEKDTRLQEGEDSSSENSAVPPPPAQEVSEKELKTNTHNASVQQRPATKKCGNVKYMWWLCGAVTDGFDFRSGLNAPKTVIPCSDRNFCAAMQTILPRGVKSEKPCLQVLSHSVTN